MKTIIKRLLAVLACPLYLFASGQESPSILSPDVATLGKFGTYPVSHYTGTPDISVPLYTLQHDDIEVPLTLQYDASGVMVNKDAGIVGQNWTLQCGGLITRTVNGIPDEKYFTTSTGAFGTNTYGYWYGINKFRSQLLTASQVKSLSYFKRTDIIYNDLKFEHTPDIFTFSFNGQSGRFLIDNTGNVKIIGDSPYKVDLSELALKEDGQVTQQINSKITITDPKGYKYVFGGSVDNLEMSFPLRYESSESSPYILYNMETINAWYLSCIICPNGEKITFTYQKTDVSYLYTPKDTVYLQKTYYYADVQKACVYTKTHSSCNNSVNDNRKKLAVIKLAYLKKIESPFCTISFSYSKREHSFYGTEAYRSWNRPTQKLDAITISDTKDPIRAIGLQYNYQHSEKDAYRLLLSEVANNDQVYRFEYGDLAKLPHPLTFKVDLWGYYTQYNNTNRLLPNVNIDKSTFPVDMSHRKADTTACRYGLMNKITYPTGGYSQFFYEGHVYGTVVRKTGKSIAPEFITETGCVGGARIKAIKNNAGETRRFYYTSDYPDKGKASSGVSTDFAVLCGKIQYYFNNDNGDVMAYYVSANSIASAASISESAIGYNEVTEVNNSLNGGYIKNFYSTYLTNPDQYDLGDGTRKIYSDGLRNEADFILQMSRLHKYSGCASERGHLLKKAYLNTSNDTIMSESYIYNTDPNRFKNAVYTYDFPFAFNKWGIYSANAIYCYAYNPSVKITREYLNGQYVERKETFKYNARNQLFEKRTRLSDSKLITERYKYPANYADIPELVKMGKANIVGPIVEKTTILEGESSQVIASEYYKYSEVYPGIYKPVRTDKFEAVAPASLDDYAKLMKPIFYYDYNEQGKVISAQQTDGVETTYQWKYAGQYPVVKIENAATIKTNAIQTVAVPISEPAQAYEFKHGGGTIAFTYHGREYLNGWKLNRKYEHLGPGYVNIASGLLRDGLVYSSDYDAGEYQIIFYAYDYSVTLNYNHPYTIYTENFFYNGFEETTHNEHKPFAGSGYHPGHYPVPYKKPDNKKYIIDYRVYSGSVWEMKSQEFTDNMTLSGNAIDEVRVYSSEALMTTYTYKPLIGMTSETDPSGRTIFYEYDTSGRLCNIKDEGGNILKTYRYHYKQE